MNEKQGNESCCGKNSSDASCSCLSNESDSLKPDGRKMPKVIICLVVLLAVISIVAFKVIGSESSNAIAVNDTATFRIEKTAWGVASPDVDTVQAEQILGESLESLGKLNTVAMDYDVVFIFIPDTGNAIASDTTKAAITETQKILADNNIPAGLFTLSYDSADYSGISGQVELPVILVATKGAGAILVPGNNVNANILLQAFLSCCDTSTGCCP